MNGNQPSRTSLVDAGVRIVATVKSRRAITTSKLSDQIWCYGGTSKKMEHKSRTIAPKKVLRKYGGNVLTDIYIKEASKNKYARDAALNVEPESAIHNPFNI